jgi:hypothetical protein
MVRSRYTVFQRMMAATIRLSSLARWAGFRTTVAQLALAIEEDGSCESVSGLAFVEPDLHTPAQLWIFHPLQHEQRMQPSWQRWFGYRLLWPHGFSVC